MTNSTSSEFKSWVEQLPKGSMDVWREAMTNIRLLHADVWNGVRLFLTVNSVIIAGGLTIMKSSDPNSQTFAMLTVLAVLGLGFTGVAFRIFTFQRQSFVEMLLQKTLLDKQLGFYDTTIDGVDLSFPWKVPGRFVPDVRKDPEKWKKEQRWRKGSISSLLRMVFIAMSIIYAMGLIALLVAFEVGYFNHVHCA
jgi:hypothetical protein